jgi:hypothetical protein
MVAALAAIHGAPPPHFKVSARVAAGLDRRPAANVPRRPGRPMRNCRAAARHVTRPAAVRRGARVAAASASGSREWTFLSNHGQVLVCHGQDAPPRLQNGRPLRHPIEAHRTVAAPPAKLLERAALERLAQ